MKCLETRKIYGLKWRRYRKPNGRTVKTIELPWTLWVHVRSTVLKALPGYEKAEAARDRIAVVEALLREGNKSEWIADTVGLTGSRVRQILARMRERDRRE